MEKIIIQLAGVNISITANNSDTLRFYSEFKTCGKAEYSIQITSQRIEQERDLLISKYPHRSFENYEIENNAIYREIPKVLLKERVLMIHGVLVSMDGNGYLFTAPSGIGKSTHAKIWTEVFHKRAFVINGDKPLLKLTKNGVVAFGSPWKGKEKIGNNQHVQLSNICFIQRGETNTIEKLNWNSESILHLVEQTMIPGSQTENIDRIRWFKDASKFVSLYNLQCNMSLDAALVAYNGMADKR